jgi:hypothetical protein
VVSGQRARVLLEETCRAPKFNARMSAGPHLMERTFALKGRLHQTVGHFRDAAKHLINKPRQGRLDI